MQTFAKMPTLTRDFKDFKASTWGIASDTTDTTAKKLEELVTFSDSLLLHLGKHLTPEESMHV